MDVPIQSSLNNPERGSGGCAYLQAHTARHTDDSGRSLYINTSMRDATMTITPFSLYHCAKSSTRKMQTHSRFFTWPQRCTHIHFHFSYIYIWRWCSHPITDTRNIRIKPIHTHWHVAHFLFFYGRDWWPPVVRGATSATRRNGMGTMRQQCGRRNATDIITHID